MPFCFFWLLRTDLRTILCCTVIKPTLDCDFHSSFFLKGSSTKNTWEVYIKFKNPETAGENHFWEKSREVYFYQRMRWLDSISDSVDMNMNKLWETVEERGAWHAAVYGVAESQTWLSNWTTKMYTLHFDTYCKTLTNLYFSLPPIKCIVLEDID